MMFQARVEDIHADVAGGMIYDINQLRLRLLAEAPMMTMSEMSAVTRELDELAKITGLLSFSGTVRKWISEREGQ